MECNLSVEAAVEQACVLAEQERNYYVQNDQFYIGYLNGLGDLLFALYYPLETPDTFYEWEEYSCIEDYIDARVEEIRSRYSCNKRS